MMLIEQRYPDFCPGLTEILLVLPDILQGLPDIWGRSLMFGRDCLILGVDFLISDFAYLKFGQNCRIA